MTLVRRWLPIALLLVVAAWHITMVVVWDHSSWGAGAGFGMYSKVDAHPYRFTRARLTFDGRTVPVALPPQVHAHELEWRVLPTETRGQRLANALLDLTWDDDGRPAAAGRRAERAQVELFALEVDRDAHQVDARSKRIVEVHR